MTINFLFLPMAAFPSIYPSIEAIFIKTSTCTDKKDLSTISRC